MDNLSLSVYSKEYDAEGKGKKDDLSFPLSQFINAGTSIFSQSRTAGVDRKLYPSSCQQAHKCLSLAEQTARRHTSFFLLRRESLVCLSCHRIKEKIPYWIKWM